MSKKVRNRTPLVKRGYMVTLEQFERMKLLRSELTKLRCWLTGFHAGSNNQLTGLPGEESLVQIQQLFDTITRDKRR